MGNQKSDDGIDRVVVEITMLARRGETDALVTLAASENGLGAMSKQMEGGTVIGAVRVDGSRRSTTPPTCAGAAGRRQRRRLFDGREPEARPVLDPRSKGPGARSPRRRRRGRRGRTARPRELRPHPRHDLGRQGQPREPPVGARSRRTARADRALAPRDRWPGGLDADGLAGDPGLLPGPGPGLGLPCSTRGSKAASNARCCARTRRRPECLRDARRVRNERRGIGEAGTRRRFPQVSADLSVRWCSPYCKIDVAAAAINNQDRFLGRRTLVITGERAAESTARSPIPDVRAAPVRQSRGTAAGPSRRSRPPDPRMGRGRGLGDHRPPPHRAASRLRRRVRTRLVHDLHLHVVRPGGNDPRSCPARLGGSPSTNGNSDAPSTGRGRARSGRARNAVRRRDGGAHGALPGDTFDEPVLLPEGQWQIPPGHSGRMPAPCEDPPAIDKPTRGPVQWSSSRIAAGPSRNRGPIREESETMTGHT